MSKETTCNTNITYGHWFMSHSRLLTQVSANASGKDNRSWPRCLGPSQSCGRHRQSFCFLASGPWPKWRGPALAVAVIREANQQMDDLSLTVFSSKPFFKIYLFERQNREKGKDRVGGRIFHPLVHFLKAPNSQNWARRNQEAENSI